MSEERQNANGEAGNRRLGEEVTLVFHDVASDGRGVGRLEDGCVVLADDVIDGERVTVEITAVHKKHLEARPVSIEEVSSHRVDPSCPLFGRCGGCRYQHIAYDHQLELKQKQVHDALERIGGLDGVTVEPTVASPAPYGYRNKIALHSLGRRHGKKFLGFRARDDYELLPVEQCPIADERINRCITSINEFIAAADGPGRLPHQVVFRTDGRAAYQDWLAGGLPDAAPLPRTLEMEESGLPGGRILVPDTAFYQTNFAVHRLLLDEVRRVLMEAGRKQRQAFLVDAYCGAGVFLLLLADLVETGVGIETHRAAIRCAEENAGRAKLTNLSFRRGEVAVQLPRALTDLLERYGPEEGAVLVDPPRCGMDPRSLAELCERGVATIIYVSCNPATLARDLKKLVSAGYVVGRVVPFDMFPQTVHCETLAVLSRRPFDLPREV